MAMTFRPSDEAAQALEKIKDKLYLKTNSKAIEYVLTTFLDMRDDIRDLEAELARAQSAIRAVNRIIKNKARADAEYQRLVAELVSEKGV